MTCYNDFVDKRPWTPKVAELTPPPTSGFRKKIVRLALRFGESKREDRTVIIIVIILANKPLYPWLWCFVISCHPNSDEGARHGYFVRSGIVDPTNTAGTFRHAGVIGYEWSSRTSPTSSTLAYWFEFNATESRPSYGPYDRYNGLPLRCLLYIRGGCRSFAKNNSCTGRSCLRWADICPIRL